MWRADAFGADLRGADLTDAYLNEVSLDDADLRDADLSGAQLERVVLSGARLNGCVLSGARGSVLGPIDVGADDSRTMLGGEEMIVWLRAQGAAALVEDGPKRGIEGSRDQHPPSPGGFTPERFERSMERSIELAGKTVVNDVSDLRPETVEAMRAVVERRGWGDKVIWYDGAQITDSASTAPFAPRRASRPATCSTSRSRSTPGHARSTCPTSSRRHLRSARAGR